MILVPHELRFALSANAVAGCALEARGGRFDPMGAATWLATELDADGDTLFGLADLGFGCPELGSFSLREIASIQLPFGLSIERDLGFSTTHKLSEWAAMARLTGSILTAEARLRAPPMLPGAPPDPGTPG